MKSEDLFAYQRSFKNVAFCCMESSVAKKCWHNGKNLIDAQAQGRIHNLYKLMDTVSCVPVHLSRLPDENGNAKDS